MPHPDITNPLKASLAELAKQFGNNEKAYKQVGVRQPKQRIFLKQRRSWLLSAPPALGEIRDAVKQDSTFSNRYLKR